MPPLYEVGDALRFVCLQWSIAGFKVSVHNVGAERKYVDAPAAGEWFRATPFQSAVSTVHVHQPNFAVHPLRTERH